MHSKIEKIADVSVVIPCYNSRKNIIKSIRSVFLQEMQVKEIIIVDDKSVDNSKRLLKLLTNMVVNTDVCIHIIYNEINVGPASSRNLGIKYSNCTYVAFLDSDDYWHPKKIITQYSFMLENSDVFISGHKYLEENLENELILNNKLNTREYTFSSFLIKNRCSTPTIMMKNTKEFLFSDGMRYSEDFRLWAEITYITPPFLFIDLPLAWGFKKSYGESGLSKNLLKMEVGKLKNYIHFYKVGYIKIYYIPFLIFFSIIKFLKRLLVVLGRRFSCFS